MFLHCNKIQRLAAFILIVAGLAQAPALAGQVYLQEVPDMPLPAGFAEDSAAGVAFDKPEGRIVEAVVSGRGKRDEIVVFYRNALPELGWTAIGPLAALTWHREGEALRLEMSEADSQIVVRFHIAPQ